MNEEWRTIADHPDYEVSNLGRVHSWKRRWGRADRPRLLKQHPDQEGYYRVTLDGEKRKVHRLVLIAFVGPRNDLQGAHYNGNKADNQLSNLRWATLDENAADNARLGIRKGERNPNSRFTEAEILGMRLERNYMGYSLGRIAKRYGTTKGSVSRIVNYKVWAHVK